MANRNGDVHSQQEEPELRTLVLKELKWIRAVIVRRTPHKREAIDRLIALFSEEGYCEHERPPRKIICQKLKGHKGSHHAVVFWEDEMREQP